MMPERPKVAPSKRSEKALRVNAPLIIQQDEAKGELFWNNGSQEFCFHIRTV